MKKALSIILCLAMLMSTVPMSVFAAPAAVTTEDSAAEYLPELPEETQEKDGEKAELAAGNVAEPVSVIPENGETVDRRYPVVYYKFDESVVIDEADVTLENIGNEDVGGVYFDDFNNVIWVFPAEPLSTVYATNKVAYEAWTSNIAAEDGSLLYFPGVNFNLETEVPSDGENLVPFGNMEYGWTPFDLEENSGDGCFNIVQDPTNPDNYVTARTWNKGASKWPHSHIDVPWKADTTYKIVAKVMAKDFVNDAGATAATAESTIIPNPVYYVPSFSCTGKGSAKHDGQTGTVCSVPGCGKPVDREHATSFVDHPVQTEAATVLKTSGASNGWQKIEFEVDIRENMDPTEPRKLSLYSNPVNNYATEYYIDDVAIYEEVQVIYQAGRNSELTANVDQRAQAGFNGESVKLSATTRYASTKEGYVIDGWTDGTNTYAVGENYVIHGTVILTPNVVPAGDAYEVHFGVDEEFDTCYDGPSKLSIAVGETLDLTADEFKLASPVGYSSLGWKNKATGEFVTSVSGAKDADIELVAVFELRTGIVIDTAAKASELETSGVGVFDSTVPGLKVTPSNRDPYVIFDNLAIKADEYSFLDVTFVNSDAMEAGNGGKAYFFTTNDAVSEAFGVESTYVEYDADTVTYRYDFTECENWSGVCSAVRIDPYNNNAEFTVTEIQFVKNAVVEEIAVTDLAAPVISQVPGTEASVDSSVCEVTNVSWSPAAEYFKGSTEYTATVEVKISEGGHMFTEDTVVTINGSEAEVSATAKKLTAKLTFPATEAPKDIDVVLTSADTITENDGTLELTADITPANEGDVILPDTLTWEITGGDEGIATLEGNVLTAKWNGTVLITATPDYDPSQYTEYEIIITGQVGFNVAYDENTGAVVSNMPENDRAKRDFVVSDKVPTRAGFVFAGWMLTPDSDTTVTELEVTSDITLYAKWIKGGYVIEFDKAGDRVDKEAYKFLLEDGNIVATNGDRHTNSVELDKENDEAIIELGGSIGNDFYLTVEGGSTTAIDLDYVSGMEFGFRTDASGSFGYAFYFATKDADGNWIAPDHPTGGQKYIDNKIAPTSTILDGNVNTLHVVTVDTTQRDQFAGYLSHARLDIENSGDHRGKTLYIDYIKLIGAESVEAIELDVKQPKASDVVYGLDDVSTSSNKFEIKNLTWEGPELVDGKYFAGSSVYTAKIDIEAADGYSLSDMPSIVTVNGEDAEITVDGEEATISYTFPATETLETFTLRVQPAGGAAAEITTSLGTLQLEKRIYAGAGVVIPNTDVYWSIDPSQKKYGWVDENGVVTGNTDCEELIVTATSKYNPLVKTTISIRVTGQIPEKNVYFVAGTGEEVTGLPTPSTAKDEYELPTDVIPERDGYVFKGWSKVLGGDIIKVDDVKEDTTYYAVWGYVRTEEFNGSSIFTGTSGVSSTTYEDDVMVVTPSNSIINEGICLERGSGIFGTGSGSRIRRIATADIEYIEIKTNLAPDELEICVYVQSNTAQTGSNGTTTAWNESANTRFYSNSNEISNHPSQSIFDYCEKQGDWYIYKLPASQLKNWSNYLEKLRFNFIRRDAADKGYMWLPYDAGTKVKFDYIRLVGRDIPVMDITDIATPEVKGEASTTATVVQSDAFKITEMTWSPDLLGGIFFGSNTAYTLTMQVEILKGYNALSNPPARVTVNGNEAVYDRINSTKATITYTFPATEDVGDLQLVNVNLHEANDDGYVTETKQIFSGDDFDLDKFSATNNPTGKRWIGWSDTEGGELISGTINITEDADYYAYYEDITGYDFSNKYHKNIKNVKASEGTAAFDGAWAVVTPEYSDSAAVLTLDGMNVSPADYDFVEIIYDGSLEDANNDNRFDEEAAPVLKVNGSTPVALVKAEPIIASNRVSYKYTYDLTINGKPGTIESFNLAPYKGSPAWAVTSVMLVPNAPIEEAVVITGIDAPETWAAPDTQAEVSEKYVVDSVTWTSDGGFNDDGSFKSETEYTVSVRILPVVGYKITEVNATINGEEIDGAVLGNDGALTVTKTYAATDALIPFELTMADAEITVADGKVQLTPVFSVEVPVTTVSWQIVDNGPDNRSAKIDANGVVTAYYNGTVTVKATSDYNPTVSTTATVTITNQIEAYNVTFNANTKSQVTNMPENAKVKLDYVLPKTAPVREGFSFAGWVKSPTDTVSVSKDYITKDTTYYALWVRGGLHYEFFDANENSDKTLTVATVEYSNIDTENGVLEFQPKISAYNSLDSIISIENTDKSPMFKGSDYPVIVVRMTSTMSSFANHKVYYKSKDANGKDLVGSLSETESVSSKVSVTPEGYTDIVIDMSGKSGWMDGYITFVRFDPIDNGASMEHLNAVMSIDYIRAVSYETSTVEITGIDAPVAKATADMDAVAKDPSKYVITNVAWEGGLLYDYYFDGETEYTVAVTVKGASGYFVSDAPTKATINGKNATSTEYNAETGELTLKYTFPATGVLDNNAAYTLTLYGKNDSGEDVAETRTIFEGDEFAIGEYLPANVPAGKRWIGWSETAGSTENDASDTVVMDGDKTFYAVYEDLKEFDYSNFYHQFGTTVKSGTGKLAFEDGLAVVTPSSSTSDAALITPVLNINGKDFSSVEVYYSSTLTSTNNGNEYGNLFSTALKPELKFSKVSAPNDYAYTPTLSGVEKVKVGTKTYQKYTYDMTSCPEWFGTVGKLYLAPYKGFPNWGVGFIKLVENEIVFDAAEFELDAPEAWYAPSAAANVAVNEEYEVTDITWTPDVDVFAANTAYTAKITYKPAAGYKVSIPAATVNGENATVVDNGNGTYTASYTFAKTSDLMDVEVVISGGNAITTKGRYLQLEGKTVALDGTKLPVSDVTWSVSSKGTSVELATISERGRLYPLSNGTVVVTATSVYDPSVKATTEVEISNQADLVKVTFDKNTHAEVTGMPEAVYVYGNFVPEDYNVTRNGFFLTGWSVDEDATAPDKSFNITEDTTLYAKWGAGYEWPFNDASSSPNPVYRDVTYSNGVATYGPNTNESSTGQIVFEIDKMHTLGLETATHQSIEIRLSLPVASQVKYYLRSGTEDGLSLSNWDESANTNSISQSLTPANEPGKFQTVNFNLSGHTNWNMYPFIERIRLDLPQAAPEGGFSVDYIRILSSDRSVKFDGNGGLIPLYGGEVTSYKETCKLGTINLPETPVREGYEFLGWAKKTEGYTKLYNNKFTVTDEVILYAIWAPAAILDEETVEAEGAEVTANEDGSVTVTSSNVTTPIIVVADEMTVGENKTIVVKVNADYASVENGDTVLSFVAEDGTPKEVVLKEGGLSGEETLIVDLSEEGFEGTVTDVVLTLPAGVVNSLTVDSVAFTTSENAAVFEEGGDDVVSINPTVTVTQGGSTTPHPGHISYPSTGSSSVTEHSTSTTVTPADKKPVVPARPKDDSTSTGTGTGTGTGTSTTPSKFPLSKTYDGRFVDVTTGNWFYGDVEKSYRLGLMNGKSDTEFAPDGTVTLAEAITVAARMNAIYNGQTIATVTGNNWYQPYVEYATKKAIVTSGQYSDYSAPATREQVALMFVRALPGSWYKEQNLFLTIPDVPASNASFAAIQRLYNAGVVIGVDDNYNFKPAENIKRSELSAIINRVALPDSRIRIVTEDEKNNKDKKFGADELRSTLVIGNCVDKEWVDMDGYPGAVPAKPDPVVNGLQDLMGGSLNADEYKKIKVVFTSSKASSMAGKQSQLFFSKDGSLSEANSLRAVVTKNADGTLTASFDGNSNKGWNGNMTLLRFDPWNESADFALISVTFAP